MYGKCWRLVGKVKDENEFNDFCKEHRLHKDNKGKETIGAGCYRKSAANKCKYRLIFVRKTGCLYAYGEHNHSPMPRHQGEKFLGSRNFRKLAGFNYGKYQKFFLFFFGKIDGIYVDRHGKYWRLIGKVETTNEMDEFCKQQRLQCNAMAKEIIRFYCKNGRSKKRPKCPFRAIYIRETGCLYAHGEHNHPQASEVKGSKFS